MRALLICVRFFTALILLLGITALPQQAFAGKAAVPTQQQWERTQRRALFLRGQYDKLLQQARRQRALILAWQRKTRLAQERQRRLYASKQRKRHIVVAASR
ncbi:MAG: hypothetical protein WBG50_21740 [Desulfomonilaceae bacterium]